VPDPAWGAVGDVDAAETDIADAHVAEERATRRVVSPRLFLVTERRRTLPGNDDRIHSRVRIPGGGRHHVVGAGHRNCSRAFECLVVTRRAEVGRDVGVVHSRARGPGELAIGAALRSQDELCVTVETRPFSRYFGRVPIDPTCEAQEAGLRQSRAVRVEARLVLLVPGKGTSRTAHANPGARVRARSRSDTDRE